MLPVLCLMGPTASGKTALAVEIMNHFPCEIISVDSAMVYRGLNIGTAKPDASILAIVPHHLIDIRDPVEAYSAGAFREDALSHIETIRAKGRIPLLVGGTMLYFRVLQQGLAMLPRAHAELRHQWQLQADSEGWEALHAMLALVDPKAAQRIHRQDGQRIQRALEVFTLTGKSITAWQQESTYALSNYRLCFLGLAPDERSILHQQIALRFQHMLQLGFVEEVRSLYERGDLMPDLPAIRAVGYRQAWGYFSGQLSYEDMCEQAIIATRQLAKRQLTWLRSWPTLTWLSSNKAEVFSQIARCIDQES